MNYFDYYVEEKRRNERDPEAIQGLCTDMCPADEAKLRIREKMVHILEVSGSQRNLIKSFSRSAADAKMAVPKQLRPYPVLRQTVQYLLLDILNRPNISSIILYDFVNDRLRAVRQDMTIQRLPPKECVVLLEPMIRFHVYYGYKLAEATKEFNSFLNKKYLLQCMNWYLSSCDKMDAEKPVSIDQLLGNMKNLQIDTPYKLVCDRILIESLYILYNLDNLHPLERYLSLPKVIKCHPALQLSYRIAIANLQGNFVKVTKLIQRLSPLAYFAVFIHLPNIQKRGIRTMSAAYNNPRLTFPTDVLRLWLHVASDADLALICKHYGLTIENEAVHFVRNQFNDAKEMETASKNYMFDDTLDLKLEYILTYTS